MAGAVAGLASCFLPETGGKKLPETVEDAEATDDSPSIGECLRCVQFRSPPRKLLGDDDDGDGNKEEEEGNGTTKTTTEKEEA